MHTKDAVATSLKLTKEEGMMVGPSSGAAVKYAFDVASRPEAKGKTIGAPSHSSHMHMHSLAGL